MTRSSHWRYLRVLPFAIAIAVAVPAVTPASVSAQTVDGQKQKVKDIVDELDRLAEKSSQLADSYSTAIDTKAALDADIVDQQAKIAAKEAEINQLRASLGDMALHSFTGGGAAPLGPLFEDTANQTDVLQREELARIALSAGDASTDELNALVSDLNDEKAKLDDKRQQAEQLAKNLDDAKKKTDELTAQYTKARADAEATLGKLVQEEEARRAAESARQMQARAAQAARSNAAARSAPAPVAAGGGSGGGSGSNDGGSSSDQSPQAPSAPTYNAPPPSSRSGIAVSAAVSQQGVPYHYATSSPGVGFDCSGLTAYAWEQAGVSLPHQSRQQYASVPHVSPADAQPGDLIFFYSPISHVGIYLGNGMLVHAPYPGSTVSVAAVNWNKVTGVGRPG
jgi:cell wall-associated NlpC family hydrolase